jgi:Fe-S cluster biogenesis protein NfuA
MQFEFNRIRSVNPMKEKVEKALNDVRPSLQADGGDVELVDVENNIVKVRLKGACAGCPMSQMTLKQGIERYIKKQIPEIISVESV